MSTSPSAAGGASQDHAKLARHVGLVALVLYGVGDMVGAGIYATIGTAAGQMGNAVWLAFVASMCAAMLTGLSYANLASRYPRAAGASYVTQKAYGLSPLSYIVGLAVMASGLTSMGTQSNAFAQNLLAFLPAGVPAWAVVVAFLLGLTAINLWGIRESMWANAVCTLIEVGGLLLLIVFGLRFLGSVNYLETPPVVDPATGVAAAAEGLQWSLVLSGAVLTFYAFVGFEDMLNVCEEVKNPRKTMPWGMVLAILCATVLYLLVSLVAVSAVPYADLAKESAPVMKIGSVVAPWLPGWVFGAITVFAVANTSLLNYVMGSRLAFGMARQGLLPGVLAKVHPKRRTPWVAILTLGTIALVLSLVFDLRPLAKATSLLLLCVFTVVNVALVVLKFKDKDHRGSFEVPSVIPLLGAVFCVSLIANAKWWDAKDPTKWGEIPIALIMLAGILVLWAVMRPKALPEEEMPELDEHHEPAAPTGAA